MLKLKSASKHGFTLVELLIVIVVIAILAAISIVAYNGIQDRANNTVVKSDASTISKAMEMTKIDLGHYPADFNEMPKLKISKNAYDISYHNLHYCYNATNDEYALNLRSKADVSFIVTSSGVEEVAGVAGGGAPYVCGLIDTTWENRDFGFLGYSSASGKWNGSLNWVKE